jgi:hypothetical protein
VSPGLAAFTAAWTVLYCVGTPRVEAALATGPKIAAAADPIAKRRAKAVARRAADVVAACVKNMPELL